MRKPREYKTRDPRWPKGRPGAGQARKSKKGIQYTVCGHAMKIQTLIFPFTHFSERSARAWATKHGFRLLKVEETTQSVRIRQNPVELFIRTSFRTIPIGKSGIIKAVVGCPKLALVKSARPSARSRKLSRRGHRERVAA